MKKLLLLFIPLVFFFSCDQNDDSELDVSENWWFNLTIDGETFALESNNCQLAYPGENWAYASFENSKLNIWFHIGNYNTIEYEQGGYFDIHIQISNPYEGANVAVIYGGNEGFFDYFPPVGGGDCLSDNAPGSFSETPGGSIELQSNPDFLGGNHVSGLQISSMGTASEIDGLCAGDSFEMLEGSYTGLIYAAHGCVSGVPYYNHEVVLGFSFRIPRSN